MSQPVLQVALPVPIHKLFDYLFDPSGDTTPVPGARVRVPFGRGSRTGIVLALLEHSDVPEQRLKSVQLVLDEVPLLSAEHLDYLRWVADYYHYPVGEVLAAALPVRLRRGDQPKSLGEAGWALTTAAETMDLTELGRATRQIEILEYLRKKGGRCTRVDLQQAVGASSQILRLLQDKRLLMSCEFEPRSSQTTDFQSGPELTAEQAVAVDCIQGNLGKFAAYLLEGVTGSGKTEVYIRLAQTVLQRGESLLLLVPEISLTPQLVDRFQQRIGRENIILLHSGMNERERELGWQQARLDQARVVIGTRSAALAPVAGLGLVVVDEEHDSSLKQQEGLRYNARDLAIVRAMRANCPVLLGSATPSLESLRNVAADRYHLLQLTERAGRAQPPRLSLVDVRDQRLDAGLSPVLLDAISNTLEQGHQVLIFLNRRGFSPVITCYTCGWLSDCPRCDAKQTLHAASGILWCHHCGSQRPAPHHCPECGAEDLHPLGQGTERLEQVLAEKFPQQPLLRVDRDATRRKGSLDKLLKQAKQGHSAIMVGTQMLAKGHHFPAVTLVGILDIDGGLFSADFRAAERMAQLVTQVAGRSGRGEKAGRVLIQTRFPDHPLLQTLVHQGYNAFARVALEERRQAEFPPYSYQALIRAEATRSEDATAFLNEVATLLAQVEGHPVSLWGPVSAPMARRAGRFRAHLLLQSASRSALHWLLRCYVGQLAESPSARRVRWSLDVDPLDLY